MAHADDRSAADGAPEHLNGPDEIHPAPEAEMLGGESNPEILPAREPWRAIVHGIGVVEQVIGALLLAVILVLVGLWLIQRLRGEQEAAPGAYLAGEGAPAGRG